MLKLVTFVTNIWWWLNKLFSCLLATRNMVQSVVQLETIYRIRVGATVRLLWTDGKVIPMTKKLSGGRKVLIRRIVKVY